ncbi:polar amino acid transport system permease protein [Labrenzia sp. EL_208]|uniref:Putative glutamine ABC transporter permease protein GlnP n=1 Tax=Roseibium album TaxID=311410 RepID=A0A0M7AX44_9HYPH|nr:amino acid ABC transporter permease [Roseibium album]MBG6147250.1 polar amino acid transport system permease protein [Labrenzia sp. EL_142]MBG6165960.1 polar amino acid transport system permease protein [Labrenzia sp. EL_195]MBG6177931.1 polar amino acid transport system permease protein [Labrenzia sp. EL_132]MBG6204842.1 polar amino acid transport system permease protein [Labrenzia sp. EL_13]MBG6210559.1 polar amino acid transport system permease protein [Labrenzia sp. EL_126]MBG6232554.1
MQETISFFSGFTPNDLWFLGEAALRTLWISALSITIGTILGGVFGWMLYEGKLTAALTLAPVLDIFRSVPLIIQLVLFYNFAPIVGLDLDPFGSGVVILTIYTAALVANVARGGIEAVGKPMRRAARSLGMSYWQDMRYVVLPIGGRAVFPAWVGVALGVMKDSALVSVLGYVELLKASQILITRTQEPFLILAIAGAFYFALSFPISRYAAKLEQRWAQ